MTPAQQLALVLVQAKTIAEVQADVAEMKRWLGRNSGRRCRRRWTISRPLSRRRRTSPRRSHIRGRASRRASPGSGACVAGCPDETMEHVPVVVCGAAGRT